MIKDNKDEAYVTIFSRKLYRYLLKKNIIPFCIEPNKKFPEFMVYKYEYSDYISGILRDYREGKLVI